jgi:hypothetical protein
MACPTLLVRWNESFGGWLFEKPDCLRPCQGCRALSKRPRADQERSSAQGLGDRAMANCCATTVGHPHSGLVPWTVTVSSLL